MAVMSWTAELTRNCKWRLGEGYFGEVFVAVETKSGKCFAIKKVVNAEHNTARQEIAVLKRVNHPNIIKYHGYHIERGVFCLVLEYADMGTLRDKIRYPWGSSGPWGPWSEVDVWRFIENIAGALNFLHSMRPPILHRDLKPDNILGVGQRGGGFFWKLADFGLATLLSENAQGAYYTSQVAGTPTYMAPEVWSDYKSYSFGADLWSLGCVLVFRCNNGRHLFFEGEEVVRWRGIGKHTVAPSHHTTSSSYSTGLVHLVSKLLNPDPKLRLSADEVLAECTLERMSPPRRKTT